MTARHQPTTPRSPSPHPRPRRPAQAANPVTACPLATHRTTPRGPRSPCPHRTPPANPVTAGPPRMAPSSPRPVTAWPLVTRRTTPLSATSLRPALTQPSPPTPPPRAGRESRDGGAPPNGPAQPVTRARSPPAYRGRRSSIAGRSGGAPANIFLTICLTDFRHPWFALWGGFGASSELQIGEPPARAAVCARDATKGPFEARTLRRRSFVPKDSW